MRLPAAFRSLSRPSSAPDAKAFPLRSFTLDLCNSSLLRIIRAQKYPSNGFFRNLSFFVTLIFLCLCFLYFCCLVLCFCLIVSLFGFQGTLPFLLKERSQPINFRSIGSGLSLSQGLVGSSGLEPPTSRLSGARSNQLSYEPILFRFPLLVEMNRFELSTPCLQGRCSPI